MPERQVRGGWREPVRRDAGRARRLLVRRRLKANSYSYLCFILALRSRARTGISRNSDSAIEKRQIKAVVLLIRTWARRCVGNYCVVTRIELGTQKFEINWMLLGAIRAESARAKYELTFTHQSVHHNSLLFKVSLTPHAPEPACDLRGSCLTNCVENPLALEFVNCSWRVRTSIGSWQDSQVCRCTRSFSTRWCRGARNSTTTTAILVALQFSTRNTDIR